MLTAARIKLIYCYLICLFLTIFLVIKAAMMTENLLKLRNFEDTYQVPYNLTKSSFHIEKDRKLSAEKIEQLRLEAIEEDKINQHRRIKNDLMLNLPYLFYSLSALALHVVLIRRTKEF
ncbi:MAG: hypothetical protein K2W94_01385 [Alphaproteobacteria bacterium]|nr:hypothetical protein [Alphaproteobacteria bacterium]